MMEPSVRGVRQIRIQFIDPPVYVMTAVEPVARVAGSSSLIEMMIVT